MLPEIRSPLRLKSRSAARFEAGAYYGMESIPQRWLKKMDRAVMAEIEAVTERLVAASPLGRNG